MNLENKIVLAHKGYFNKESEHLYRENSVEVCTMSTQKDYINIIELDIRKSKDGVLYCYHGSFIEYFFTLKFPKTFSFLKTKYHVDTLADILDVITEDKIVCLDIKSKSITRDDIINIFQNRRFKQVILAKPSVSFLRRFSEMPPEFVKCLNYNAFCNFYNMKKLHADGFKYVEVYFPFQVTKRIINKVEGNDMIFSVPGLFFRDSSSYWSKIEKYGIRRIGSDFI